MGLSLSLDYPNPRVPRDRLRHHRFQLQERQLWLYRALALMNFQESDHLIPLRQNKQSSQ